MWKNFFARRPPPQKNFSRFFRTLLVVQVNICGFNVFSVSPQKSFQEILIELIGIYIPKLKKSSLYSPYYAKACNELRGPSPRLGAWATQLRRNVATVASRWRHCVVLTGPEIEPQTSRTVSVRLATELTAGLYSKIKFLQTNSTLTCLNSSFIILKFCSAKMKGSITFSSFF